MGNAQRWTILAATIVVLVGVYFVLAPGDEDGGLSDDVATTTTQTVPTTTVPTVTRTTSGAPPAADHEPQVQTIRVRGGAPVGGVERIEVSKGERARIRVTSTDTNDEVHVHGYDVSRDLQAPGSVTFSFDANAEGIFEIELEGAHTQIGELVVEP